MPSSISCHACSSMLPARNSAQYFHESLPLPSVLPRQLPRSMGPPGMKTAGRFIDTAPMISAGVVLSQPPISTQPSAGYERSNSSVSIARKLRYSMVVGFWNGSDSDIAGISTGKPPACQTPRLTSSARCAEVAVAGIDLAPGVDHGDDRLAVVVLARVAHLQRARAMAEGAQILGAVPACAAQLFGFLSWHGMVELRD